MRQRAFLICALPWLALNESALAPVTVYNSLGNPNAKSQWQSTAGAHSTITFAEFGLPSGTWLDEQYAFLGVHFTDGSDQIYETDSFITDGFGLNGAFDDSILQFDEPMTAIGMDHPGEIKITLYSQGQMIYASPSLNGSGVGHFTGVISTQLFDKVVLHDQGLFIDNIYFGAEISSDCNLNGNPDQDDIASGLSVDLNGNSFPDECEQCTKKGDVTCNGKVNVDDLLQVINGWGLCEKGLPCPADIDPDQGDGIVDGDDLEEVIQHWSP